MNNFEVDQNSQSEQLSPQTNISKKVKPIEPLSTKHMNELHNLAHTLNTNVPGQMIHGAILKTPIAARNGREKRSGSV